MANRDSTAHLFRGLNHDYWDTPFGCLRRVQIDQGELIGTRYGQSYRVPLGDCQPASSRGAGQRDYGFEEN